MSGRLFRLNFIIIILSLDMTRSYHFEWLSEPGTLRRCLGDDVTFTWTYNTSATIPHIFLTDEKTEDTVCTYYVESGHNKEYEPYIGRTDVINVTQSETSIMLKDIQRADTRGYTLQLAGPRNANHRAELEVYNRSVLEPSLEINSRIVDMDYTRLNLTSNRNVSIEISPNADLKAYISIETCVENVSMQCHQRCERFVYVSMETVCNVSIAVDYHLCGDYVYDMRWEFSPVPPSKHRAIAAVILLVTIIILIILFVLVIIILLLYILRKPPAKRNDFERGFLKRIPKVNILVDKMEKKRRTPEGKEDDSKGHTQDNIMKDSTDYVDEEDDCIITRMEGPLSNTTPKNEEKLSDFDKNAPISQPLPDKDDDSLCEDHTLLTEDGDRNKPREVTPDRSTKALLKQNRDRRLQKQTKTEEPQSLPHEVEIVTNQTVDPSFNPCVC